MPSLALYAESVYRITPILRSKNLLAEIEQDFEAGVSVEDCASFLSAITQKSALRALPIPKTKNNPVRLNQPEALASRLSKTYTKEVAMELTLSECWRHEKGSKLFRFYASVSRALAEGLG